MAETDVSIVLDFFSDLSLLGPGTDDDTRTVLEGIVDDLPPSASVVDVGCGTGRSALVLARRLAGARVVAVDRAAPFLARLAGTVAAGGPSGRPYPVRADMMRLPFAAGSVDLIWCESAVYYVGLAEALRLWRPLLRPGGFCVVSDCVWLTDDRPRRAAAFWRANYPRMGDGAENLRRVAAAGYRVRATHRLSDRGWEDYYRAIDARLARQRPAPGAARFRDGLAEERSVYADSRGSYGYVFYVVQPDAAPHS